MPEPRVSRSLADGETHVTRAQSRMALAIGVRIRTAEKLGDEFAHVANRSASRRKVIGKHGADAGVLCDTPVKTDGKVSKRSGADALIDRRT